MVLVGQEGREAEGLGVGEVGGLANMNGGILVDLLPLQYWGPFGSVWPAPGRKGTFV